MGPPPVTFRTRFLVTLLPPVTCPCVFTCQLPRLAPPFPGSNSKLAINFAVSPQDGLTKHLKGSVGGINIDMSRGEVAPALSTPTATAPSPRPAPTPTATALPPLASPNCTPSTLGYQCMVQRVSDRLAEREGGASTQRPAPLVLSTY